MKHYMLLAAVATVSAPAIANAATVDFEDQAAFRCDSAGSGSSGGLTYTYGFAACYYSPASPADFPTPITSTVMASGYSSTTFSLTGGGSFGVSNLDLAFGPFSHGGANSNTTTVTGNLTGGGTVSTVLTVGYGFQNYALNWNGLDSITFGELQGNREYLAFDNIVYNVAGGVPEASTWALLILGFGAIGGTMRSRSPRRIAAAI